jgi:predicted porin
MSWAGRNSSAIDEYIWHNNDTINFKQENTESKYRFNSQNVNLSADYKINDNNSLGFTLNYSHDKQPNIDNPAIYY